MSSYYPSFNYMGFNSLTDKKLIVTHFDADNGQHDTFLSMDCIYTDNVYGTCRYDYGAKYNSVAVINITVIKANGRDFTVSEVRDFLRWTTGARHNSYLDLVDDGKVKFSFLGRVTNAYQQKLDARTIGLAIEFTSVSPWAYSKEEFISCSFGQSLTMEDSTLAKTGQDLSIDDSGLLNNGVGGMFNITEDGVVYIDNSVVLNIDNKTDDLYSYVNLETKFTNVDSDHLIIKNETLYEESNGADGLTEITGMVKGEEIKLTSEQFIISDAPEKIFGDDFNFIWPKLMPGENKIIVNGTGKGFVEFVYRYPIKIGDCTIDIDISTADINCGEYDPENPGVIVGSVSWNDITDKPTTRSGYNLTDVYTMAEVNSKLNDVNMSIDEAELNNMLDNVLGD